MTPTDNEGEPEEDESTQITLIDPDYWRAHPDALAEALADADQQLEAAQTPTIMTAIFLFTVRAFVHAAMAIPSILTGATIADPKPQQRRLTLTVEEAAERLGISRAFAYESVRRGDIPHIKIGRRILVPIAALDKLLDSASPSDEDEGVGE